jgi:succinate dehydrogenase/fumarate reductase flavoprotein subunit
MARKWSLPPLPQTDVLVTGGGAAGLRAALSAREQGALVILASDYKIGRANNSSRSNGGFCAVPPEGYQGDTRQQHCADILSGSRGLGKPKSY